MPKTIEELAIEYVMLVDDQRNYTFGAMHMELAKRRDEIWEEMWSRCGNHSIIHFEHAREVLKMVGF